MSGNKYLNKQGAHLNAEDEYNPGRTRQQTGETFFHYAAIERWIKVEN